MEKEIKKKIQQIKQHSNSLKEKSYEELVELRNNLFKKSSLPSESFWFAFAQEISSRVLNLRPFNAQLIAGLALNQGQIIDMKTGEGKTLASALSLSYRSLDGKGAHFITTNEYLAKILIKIFSIKIFISYSYIIIIFYFFR